MASYPTLAWVRNNLRNNLTSRRKEKVLVAFIVGSEAKGTATSTSDLDIALIIKRKPKLSALKLTERYHAKFVTDAQKPVWNGRIVDFQFFYEDDTVLETYQKIAIEKG